MYCLTNICEKIMKDIPDQKYIEIIQQKRNEIIGKIAKAIEKYKENNKK